jgi:hypothetical protein
MPFPSTNGLFPLVFWPCRVILCYCVFPLLVKRLTVVAEPSPEWRQSKLVPPPSGLVWRQTRLLLGASGLSDCRNTLYTHEVVVHTTVLNSRICCYLFVIVTSLGLETGYWKTFQTIRSLILMFNKVGLRNVSLGKKNSNMVQCVKSKCVQINRLWMSFCEWEAKKAEY